MIVESVSLYHPSLSRGGRLIPPHPFLMIDIKNSPQTLEAINAILNAKNIAEVKIEPKGVAVIEIKRQVKSIEKTE